ncbi:MULTISPECIES: hypothetical protein [unclassified Mucilaginibacter]|uniref:hypothetical protein n=1 Tax=unclassified Mucilaginibacter TaxID=2617802 RepID=UPI0031F6E3A5
MKNTMKALGLAVVIAALTSCQSGTPKGTTDSVANHPSDTGTSVTVDTMSTSPDTATTDSTK